jgi:predicted dehydrogenase
MDWRMSVQLETPAIVKPKLGFLGIGWIGQHRMQAILDSNCAEVTALADSVGETLAKAQAAVPEASLADNLDDLLEMDLDGIVIATPSALHAEQAERALKRGVAVFCQKPLGRNTAETRYVVEAARAANRLLAVDLSYRFVEGMKLVRDWVQSGELGDIFAVQATFHNAYGPDKPWFYQRSISGGGCLLDLGIHLVDLALWTLDWPKASPISAQLISRADRLRRNPEAVEDYAAAQIQVDGGAALSVTCSWNLPLGRDAEIEISFFGSRGGASLKNIDGSFFDFTIERYNGTKTEAFSAGDRRWFGAAAIAWARRLQAGQRFDPECERLVDVAAVLDAIYEQGGA